MLVANKETVQNSFLTFKLVKKVITTTNDMNYTNFNMQK